MDNINFCSKCGVRCSDRMRIQARKNKDYVFCSYCFNILQNLDMKEVRKEIKIQTFK